MDSSTQLALLADGAVMAKQGDTVVMVSAVSNRNEMDDGGFLPLSVEYRQKVRVARGRPPFLSMPSDTESFSGLTQDAAM